MTVNPRGGPNWWWAVTLTIASALLLASIVPVPGGEAGSFPIALPLHFVGYAALACALVLAIDPERRDAAYVFAGSTAYGAFVEVLQYPLPYRTFEYGDIAVNALGAAVAILGWWLYHRFTV